MNFKPKKLFLSAVCLFAGFLIPLLVFRFWQERRQPETAPLPAVRTYQPFVIPSATPPAGTTPPPSNTSSSSSLPLVTLPEEINLAIPFTSQAPHKNWDMPYQEFCEEASMLMTAGYVLGKDIPNADYADRELLKIMDFEMQKFGYFADTTAEESATVLREYFGLERVSVKYDPTLEEIKRALAENRAVLLPAAGRQLPNPNFRQPGPLYHMLVIKGYTKDGQMITNDPGTRNGKDFLYNPEDLLKAMHDWNGGDVENGNKVVIIVG